MDDLIEALERAQMCQTLTRDMIELIDRCIDEGYESLGDADKALIRRLVNRQSAAAGSGALARWRERKRQNAGSGAKGKTAQGASRP